MASIKSSAVETRNLIIVLGDQLDRDSSVFDGFDASCDRVVMAEVAEEATHVWSHKARIALFLSAMRHFAQALIAKNWSVIYLPMGTHDWHRLESAFAAQAKHLRPERLVVAKPGDWRVEQSLIDMAARLQLPLEIRPDRHFFTTPAEFLAWAEGRRELRLEYFYRELRKRHRILMDGDKPCAGRWSLDAENRSAFGKRGPGALVPPRRFLPDTITTEVMAEVATRYADHPGQLESFDWPVTPEDAQSALVDFVTHRLAQFGQWQDAMWTDQDWLYHSRLSAAMNLKLISPRHVVATVERAYREGAVPLAAAEGFIRQVLGWREYVRGLYWMRMPQYADDNAMDANVPLPAFYWTGQTHMHCLQQTLKQTLRVGYAHHIQRLMVTGLFALLLGVRPRALHEWYLAIYVDAVEWVELPNTIGMSQYADGGVMASKPYIASGKYIQRMSNYCTGCRYDPAQATGTKACPFTTLYWEFLSRHRLRLRGNARMLLQIKNLERMSADEIAAIDLQAAKLRSEIATAAG
jgi:deoxyribodipyrimidine photolyase-related protein